MEFGLQHHNPEKDKHTIFRWAYQSDLPVPHPDPAKPLSPHTDLPIGSPDVQSPCAFLPLAMKY
ncbi:hypothetical protein D3C81_1309490 [compost metagenome]